MAGLNLVILLETEKYTHINKQLLSVNQSLCAHWRYPTGKQLHKHKYSKAEMLSETPRKTCVLPELQQHTGKAGPINQPHGHWWHRCLRTRSGSEYLLRLAATQSCLAVILYPKCTMPSLTVSGWGHGGPKSHNLGANC